MRCPRTIMEKYWNGIWGPDTGKTKCVRFNRAPSCWGHYILLLSAVHRGIPVNWANTKRLISTIPIPFPFKWLWPMKSTKHKESWLMGLTVWRRKGFEEIALWSLWYCVPIHGQQHIVVNMFCLHHGTGGKSCVLLPIALQWCCYVLHGYHHHHRHEPKHVYLVCDKLLHVCVVRLANESMLSIHLYWQWFRAGLPL